MHNSVSSEREKVANKKKIKNEQVMKKIILNTHQLRASAKNNAKMIQGVCVSRTFGEIHEVD
jgi:hypothetical protein